MPKKITVHPNYGYQCAECLYMMESNPGRYGYPPALMWCPNNKCKNFDVPCKVPVLEIDADIMVGQASNLEDQ